MTSPPEFQGGLALSTYITAGSGLIVKFIKAKICVKYPLLNVKDYLLLVKHALQCNREEGSLWKRS
jgi:hypothetical protein